MRQRPNIRYTMVALAMGMNVLNYADRVCISILAPKIRADLNLDSIQMGMVFGIFSIAYALGQAPWGLWAEANGARKAVAWAACAWSLFSAATGLAWNYASLLAIRVLFAVCEAALSPSVAAAFRRWLPPREAPAGFGFLLAGGRLGAAVTPWVVGNLLAALSWRELFLYFAPPGVIGAAVWFYWYRDEPAQHPAITPQELALLPQLPGTLQSPNRASMHTALRSSRFWSLIGTAFGATFLWQFYITWFPQYLTSEKHFSMAEASLYAGLPFALGLAGTMSGGLITSLLARKIDVNPARRVIGLVSLCSAAVLVTAGLSIAEPRLAAILMASAAGFLDLYLGAAWAAAIEIGGESGGGVAGLMNGASNAAGFLSPVIFGWLLQSFGNWNIPLGAGIVSTLVAAILWLNVTRRAPGNM